MPIVWKTQFTFPFIAKLLSGSVKDPISFAGAIASTYDSCIKTGFPLPPAPPVPFTTGKTPLLKSAIAIGFGLKLLQIILKILKGNQKSFNLYFGKINKQLSQEANELSSQLNQALKSYDNDVKETLKGIDDSTAQLTFNYNTPPPGAPVSAGQYVVVDIGDPCIKKYVIPLQNIDQATFNNWVNGQVDQDAKDAIKKSILETYNQNSNMISSLGKNILDSASEANDELNDRRKLYIQFANLFPLLFKILFTTKPNIIKVIAGLPLLLRGIIKNLNIPVKEKIKTIKELNSKLNSLGPEAAAQAKTILESIQIETEELKKYTSILSSIPKSIAKIFLINPLKLINFPELDFKSRIREVNQYISKQMDVAANEINELNKNKSNLYKDMSSINDAKNAIAKAISEAQNVLGSNVNSTNLDNEVRNQLATILPCTCLSDEDKNNILSLSAYNDGSLGVKAKSLVGSIDSKGKNRMASIDADIDDVQKRLENLRNIKRRNGDIDKNFDFRTPENLFDIALGVGLLAYWLGGVIPSAGIATVILPGLPPVALGLKTNFKGPLKFFTSLELIFQVHAFTVAGIYTPPPPAPPLPWVGYF